MKLPGEHYQICGPLSPPARGRGLKQRDLVKWSAQKGVAPRTGAWIETAHPEGRG